MKRKVAVMGSCLTRDVFNSKFNLNYKHYFECVLTQNQTSIISLMSPPVNYDKSKIDNLEPYNEWNVHTDLNKEFLQRIIEMEPDVLLIDFFADIYFGILQLQEGVYITNNRWKLWKTSYYRELSEKKVLNLNADSEAYIPLWKSSIDRFFGYIQPRLPNLKIILVDFLFVDQYLSSKDHRLYKLNDLRKENFDVDFANSHLKWMNQYVVDYYGVIRVDMTKKNYHSFDGHIWNPFYVHYTMDYYQDFLLQLVRLLKFRIAVFETGGGAEQLMERINHDVVDVQCFVDNNPAKQQTTFMGHRVISPAELADVSYDCIVIASQFSTDIMKQLLTLGVPFDKIIPYFYVNHNRTLEKYHQAAIDQLIGT